MNAMSGSAAVRKISRGVVKMTRGCFSKTGPGPLCIGPAILQFTCCEKRCAIRAPQVRDLVRQTNSSLFVHANSGSYHHFPGMVVRIGKISGIAAIVGLVRGLQ